MKGDDNEEEILKRIFNEVIVEIYERWGNPNTVEYNVDKNEKELLIHQKAIVKFLEDCIKSDEKYAGVFSFPRSGKTLALVSLSRSIRRIMINYIVFCT